MGLAIGVYSQSPASSSLRVWHGLATVVDSMRESILAATELNVYTLQYIGRKHSPNQSYFANQHTFLVCLSQNLNIVLCYCWALQMSCFHIICSNLTLNQPPTCKCVQRLHKSIRMYIHVGIIILGTSTLYINFCLFKQIPMASKGIRVNMLFLCL